MYFTRAFCPRALTGTVAVSVLLVLVGCSKPAPKEEPIRAVRVIEVGAQPLSASTEYAAELRARVESKLSFRVSGKLVKRWVELGQAVKAGQVLAQLDQGDFELSADALRAQWNVAASNRDLAAADFKRYQALREQNFISGAELERRQASLKTAQAQLDQAQAQLTLQTHQAGYTRLQSDVAGVVVGVDAEVGQVVSAGVPVLRVAQLGAVDAVFSVPEDRVNGLKLGMPAQIRVWAQPAAITGVVREVAASADPVTRTYAVKVALPSSEALPLGASATVSLGTMLPTPSAAIKLPSSAVFQAAGQSQVWVLDRARMTVAMQAVVVGGVEGNALVLASGPKPGTLVVSAGVHALSPGQKVSLYQDGPSEAQPISARSSAAASTAASAAPAASAAMVKN